MVSAFAADGTSRATISLSRDSSAMSCSCAMSGASPQTFKLCTKEIGDAGVSDVVHLVEG